MPAFKKFGAFNIFSGENSEAFLPAMRLHPRAKMSILVLIRVDSSQTYFPPILPALTKFKNKYRIESHRRPGWNYAADALYFITIVTQNRACNLGEIVQGEMMLSAIGTVVEMEWFNSFDLRKELLLDEFIIMPNHLHAIVEIRNSGVDCRFEKTGADGVDTHGPDSVVDNNETDSVDTDGSGGIIDTNGSVGFADTHGRVYQRNQPESPVKRNAPVRLPRSLSSFIGGFKSAVNSRVDDYIDTHQLTIPKYNKHNHFFQPNYYDHIIRNEQEYWQIKQYIANNPKNWKNDSIFANGRQ